MPKHKKDKLSEVNLSKKNKAGQMPQVPNLGSNNKNQYR
jgi:hypothetical protein